MTLSLTDEKKKKIKTLLMNCLHSHQISIRELARISGNIAASFPAVTFEPLYYRHLERDKISGLKYHKDNFEGKISLSKKALSEILHATMLTTSRILTLPYTQMPALQVVKLPME